jgi:hypothetical protein
MRTVPHRTVQHAHSTGMRRREASKGGQGRGARADKDGEQPGESSSAVSAQEQEHSGVTVSAQDWFESASYARERFVICGALQYTDASTRHQSTARGTGAKDALGRAPRALTTAVRTGWRWRRHAYRTHMRTSRIQKRGRLDCA